MLIANVSGHDVDLDSGRVLARFDRAEVAPTDRERLLIDQGLLAEVAPDPVPEPASAVPAAAPAPVAPAAAPAAPQAAPSAPQAAPAAPAPA
ncbi:MAG: hypothetical protein JWO98_4524, partial [Frankiales bacterium]|nr:hypothetical protein [Frankiales bacterium]